MTLSLAFAYLLCVTVLAAAAFAASGVIGGQPDATLSPLSQGEGAIPTVEPTPMPTLLSNEALAATLETWLGPRLYGLSTLAQAAEADLCGALRDLLGARAGEVDELAPTHLTVATGSRIRIDYSGEHPTASVRLQETFGMASTPRVAGGREPVLLQLLSPAMRPVQITADLARFWREGYPLVRKELRGRYPRHEWPEDPAHAQATRRAKPRR